MQVWRAEDVFMVVVLSIHFSVGSRDWTLVARFIGKCLYLL